MTDHSENNVSDERLTRAGHSRRDILKFGSIATLGAVLGGVALPGRAAPVLAQAGSEGELAPNDPLDILIVNYDGGTLLDFAGPSEIFHRLPNTNVRYASLNGGSVTLEFGVVYGKTERLADIEKTDVILVPGGSNLAAPMRPEYQAQIRRLADSAKHVTSVCNGSLVLAATGVLKGKRSACHWAFVNKLSEYGAIPVPDRFVEDDNGRFMSGGGVTAGIDFALRVAAKLRGQQAAEFTQLAIEYDPAPPFHSGHPRDARPEVIAMVDKELPGASRGLARIPGVR
ncbi:DJ-1/PfpI family protein [Paraburkholderia caballeronis]|uniref:DJ-1/PfpI family protein n=1 Tax=Paraburkholderia caballeronis TaxID=416943 RepID=A0A1H7LUM4_9BURK|nr:DJ-1/PfpI family protein [Paraburkholderia caballeronis]PXW28595.1 DJ-1/PfpI family protein [Paraburkholderia caballeronis]PXX03961.1 DJ-1/PfpI family protein [Paraburkholderia caballeronis]RAK04705.1 DJ-1/PfpI family protein [Paraburkholderia caballeronis]SED68828.1 DJ-1/PfpI family protein [Paraburkholderia caballeronis]SEL02205.1 DJ-1/PfpI family protein [Paraburkholderia caballeronis]